MKVIAFEFIRVSTCVFKSDVVQFFVTLQLELFGCLWYGSSWCNFGRLLRFLGTVDPELRESWELCKIECHMTFCAIWGSEPRLGRSEVSSPPFSWEAVLLLNWYYLFFLTSLNRQKFYKEPHYKETGWHLIEEM